MYSLPMAFEGSSLQSRILGIGTLVLACTETCLMVSIVLVLQMLLKLTIPDSCDFGISG
jgi:hypothetical protein